MDSTGSLISYSQSIKYFTSLRFIRAYPGEIFENFLEKISEGQEPKSTYDKDTLIMNRRKSSFRLDRSNYPMTSLDTIILKILPFIFLFLLSRLLRFLIDTPNKESKISPLKFYFFILIDKLYFTVFNLFLESGTLISTRSMVHLNIWPKNDNLKLDKVINAVAIIFVAFDCFDIISVAFEKGDEDKKISDTKKTRSKNKLLTKMLVDKAQDLKTSVTTKYKMKALNYKSGNVNKPRKIKNDINTILVNLPERIEIKHLSAENAHSLGFVKNVDSSSA